MKHLKTYENWVKNILYNLDYNQDTIIFSSQREKLEKLGFVTSDMSIFTYNSLLTSQKIIVKCKYKPAPGLEPGKYIYKVTIIDNKKKKIKWFHYFNDMIKYLDEIIPEHYITKKYNL